MSVYGARSSGGKANDSQATNQDGGFHFVVMRDPRDSMQQKTRKQIRSHVTKVQHQRIRERLQNSNATSTTAGAVSSTDHSVSTRRSAAIAKKGEDLATAHENVEDATKIDHQQESTHPLWASENSNRFAIASSELLEAFSRGTMSFRTFALQDSSNVVGKNLRELGLGLSSVMGLYKTIVKLQANDFDQQYAGLVEPGVGCERYYAFIFSEPILLLVAILLTVRYQLGILQRDLDTRLLIPILELESYLVSSVNAALGDSARAVSDGLLMTVALCACYELKCGNVERYHFHMGGLVRMLSVRGGLRAVASSNPYAEKLLIWHDINTSQIIGSTPWLANLDRSDSISPTANLVTFREPIEEERRKSSGAR